MDEHAADILKKSTDILNKLQLLSVFFENDTIYRIYLRTQVIHRLFENNPELDFDKLELFHLQFTASVIDLLKKMKKDNERNELLFMDEMQLNKDMISQITEESVSEDQFNLEKQRHALKVNQSLRNIFNVLSENTSDYPYSKNINAFSVKFASDFYYYVSPELFQKLTQYNVNLTYSNAYVTIHKKLMGQLCKADFRSEFYMGLKTGDQILEVFKLSSNSQLFLYFPSRNLFIFCSAEDLVSIERVNTYEKRVQILQELMDKNDMLKSRIYAAKTFIPNDVKNLLNDAYLKLSEVDFMSSLSSVDVQANILKTMLNTKMI